MERVWVSHRKWSAIYLASSHEYLGIFPHIKERYVPKWLAAGITANSFVEEWKFPVGWSWVVWVKWKLIAWKDSWRARIANECNMLSICYMFINRAAMGRARFLIYPWFFFFSVCRLNQTSLGQNSNDAIYVGGQTQTSIRPNRVRDFESRNLWCLFTKSCWNINRGNMLRILVSFMCVKYTFFGFSSICSVYLICISSLMMNKPGGGGGTPLYKVYRYVPPQRVWFLSRFGLKLGMVIEGTFMKAYKLIFLPSNQGE